MIYFKGILNDLEKLPGTKLPENAVPFKEPKSMAVLNAVALFVSVVLVFFYVLLLSFLCGAMGRECPNFFNLYGFIAMLVAVLPHELLHAVCYPKGANTHIYISPKAVAAFVWSDGALTKKGFIFMSILPFLAFSVLPFMLWLILPEGSLCGEIAVSLSFFSTLGCSGDLMNIFNAAFQMPKGSKEILYKMNSYWYIEEELPE